MKSTKTLIFLIQLGAFIELFVALLHFVWPFSFIKLSIFDNVPYSIKSLLMLTSIALGMCMSVFAFFSFYFSKRLIHGEKTASIFYLSQGLLWIIRLVLELLFPVQIPLYCIESPSFIIIIGASIIVLLFWLPVFLVRKRQKLTEIY